VSYARARHADPDLRDPRIQSPGGAPLALKPVDANAALTDALDELRAAIEESGARIDHDVLPTVSGSRKLLTCLFQNLLGNAIKYRSAAPPEVHVRCGWNDNDRKWSFRILDNGRGFKAADAERIFEMFARCDDSDGIPGSGVGLAFCKRIVEAHGGSISAESIPGQGSEFRFVLAAAQQH
jgi:signal transduction histidine kinase